MITMATLLFSSFATTHFWQGAISFYWDLSAIRGKDMQLKVLFLEEFDSMFDKVKPIVLRICDGIELHETIWF